jgi:hypothetical protein
MRIRDGKNSYPGSKKFGSGINIPDLQHCCTRYRTMHVLQVLHLRPEDLRAAQPARPHHQKESPGQAVSGRGQFLAVTLYLPRPMTRTAFLSVVEPKLNCSRSCSRNYELRLRLQLLSTIFMKDLKTFYRKNHGCWRIRSRGRSGNLDLRLRDAGAKRNIFSSTLLPFCLCGRSRQTANFLGGGSLWYGTYCSTVPYILCSLLLVTVAGVCTGPASCDTKLSFILGAAGWG